MNKMDHGTALCVLKARLLAMRERKALSSQGVAFESAKHQLNAEENDLYCALKRARHNHELGKISDEQLHQASWQYDNIDIRQQSLDIATEKFYRIIDLKIEEVEMRLEDHEANQATLNCMYQDVANGVGCIMLLRETNPAEIFRDVSAAYRRVNRRGHVALDDILSLIF